MEHSSKGTNVEAVVRRNPSDGTVNVNGRFNGLGATPQRIQWKAAAPVTRGIGFAGSGQPYPNKEIAFENTPNQGIIDSIDGTFEFQMKDIPAGYYSGLGATYIPPVVEFESVSKASPIKKASGILWINDTAVPYRWLNGAPATRRPIENTPDSTGRSMYYIGRESLPMFENQEALLRARAYPSDMTARGWPEAEDANPWMYTPAPA